MTTDPRKRFGRFADGYVTSQSHASGDDLDCLLDIANPQPDWVLLDLATGGGHTALKFSPYVKRVHATDITPKMLNAAKEFTKREGASNIQFGLVNAEAIPFQDGSFDIVTCRIAPHHFLNPVRFIWESFRVLKVEGVLMVQDHMLPEDQGTARYIDDFERRRDPSHVRAYSRTAWFKMFEAAGLDVDVTFEVVKRHTLVVWAERQGSAGDTLKELMQMLNDAPLAAAEWMQVKDFGTPMCSFVNHHILISGRK